MSLKTSQLPISHSFDEVDEVGGDEVDEVGGVEVDEVDGVEVDEVDGVGSGFGGSGSSLPSPNTS